MAVVMISRQGADRGENTVGAVELSFFAGREE
jgi:hypothetical protein